MEAASPVPWPMQHRTAQAAIAHQLRTEILSGALLPGTRLLQAAVATRMQTSTTPVREAIRELVAEGLVDLHPHCGVIVHRPLDEELDEVYAIRPVLEALSMRKTVEHITDGQLDRAETICEAAEEVTDPSKWVQYNRDFHAVLAEASESPELSAIVRNLRNRSTLYVALTLRGSPGHITASNVQHRDLVAACRSRDTERAVAIVVEHLTSTVEIGHRQLASDA